jgi:general secretion pathway protein L
MCIITALSILTLLAFQATADSQADMKQQLSRALARSGAMHKSGADAWTDKRVGTALVVLIEDLSRLLPDDTFVSEMRFEKGKLWISGRTTDAASLLVLLGKSRRFSGASFFAPSSRTNQDKGEQFHIEASVVVEPHT